MSDEKKSYDEMRCVTEDGRPDFVGFVKALREEAAWLLDFHKDGPDKSAGEQARNDAAALLRLAGDVENLGDRQGYCGKAPTNE